MDISVYLNDDPKNPFNFGAVKKGQEKELITKSLAPAYAKDAKGKVKKAKSNLDHQIKSSASTISKSASELDSSMKGKYIKRAKEDISKIASKMEKIVK